MFKLFNRDRKPVTSDLRTDVPQSDGRTMDYERLRRNSLPASILKETMERNTVRAHRLRRLQLALDSLGEKERDFTSTDLEVSLRLRIAGSWADVYPISATLALTTRGVPLADAKLVLLQLFEDGVTTVYIPHLDELHSLVKALYLNGFSTEIAPFQSFVS
jgi:hypothetical protein